MLEYIKCKKWGIRLKSRYQWLSYRLVRNGIKFTGIDWVEAKILKQLIKFSKLAGYKLFGWGSSTKSIAVSSLEI